MNKYIIDTMKGVLELPVANLGGVRGNKLRCGVIVAHHRVYKDY